MIITSKSDIYKNIFTKSFNDVNNDKEKFKLLISNNKLDKDIMKSKTGLIFLNYYTLKERLNTKGNKGFSFYEFLNNKEQINKPYVKNFINTIRKIKPERKNKYKDYYDVFRLYYGSISSFKPTIALYIYSKYKAKRILDFSAGWGGRMIASAILPNTSYIGIDTNINLRKPYEKMINELHAKKKVKMLWKDSSKVDYSKLHYDFVFTSPPYYTLEQYSYMPKYNTFEDFINIFYKPVLLNVWKNLKYNGTMVLNLPYNMYNETVKLIGESHHSIPLVISNRDRRKNGQKIYSEKIYIWNKINYIKTKKKHKKNHKNTTKKNNKL